MENRVLLSGGLPPNNPRLIGLLQLANVLVLPSLSETFGLVILEAWVAGAPVLAARASGPVALIKDSYNGWLFDPEQPQTFHSALDLALRDPRHAKVMAARGAKLAEQFSVRAIAGKVKDLYQELIEEKHALRNHPG